MSKKSLYIHASNIKKKIKRDVAKTLEDDAEEWAAPSNSNIDISQSTSSENQLSQSEIIADNFSCHDSGASDIEANKSVLGDLQEKKLEVVDSKAAALTTCEENTYIPDDNNERSDCVWNLSFLDESHALNDSLGDSSAAPTDLEGFDHIISLRFDCEICINCSCGICSVCVHIDGISCQHCDFCRSGNDSEEEIESDNSDSDNEIENFDVDPLDELSDLQKTNMKIRNDFTDIVLQQNASHALIKKMLIFFRSNNFGDFPKCPTTLLKTQIVTTVLSVPPGEYWHRGIESDLLSYAKTSGCDKIEVSFSVDGVPLAESSGSEFYPICCTFNDSVDVVLDGIYYGKGKPQSSDVYLKPFVDEMNTLVENGIDCEARHVCIEINLAICDAVAKAWLLNVKGHAGYYSCCKCTVEGTKFGGRMAFLQLDRPKRTDESFNLQLQEEHHHGPTILSTLKSFQPVSSVVLDYMHLVLLGTMRKIMFMFLAGPKSVRQSGSTIFKMSTILESLSMWVPSDFARKCRSMKYVKKFKATEWRLLLFYVGPVLFESTLPRHLYDHFLVLSTAMTILSSEEYMLHYLEYARDLLMYFTKTFIEVYGKQYCSHNIHNLIHLADDCQKHGPVDKFSAFKFENFYQKLKKMVRKGDKPLQQLCRRYEEQKLRKPLFKENLPLSGKYNFTGLHNNGPLPPWCENPQFSRMTACLGHKLNLSQANNCCRLIDGTVVVVENFCSLKGSKDKVVVGKKFLKLENLFSFPCDSSRFGIFHASSLSGLSTWPVRNIKSKCFRMPFKDGNYVLVDFPDGPQIVRGKWITKDLKYAAWPPQANKLSGLAYDKFIQTEMECEETWFIYPVNRIRAHSDDFSKVRLKLKLAEVCSDTDLNSGPEKVEGTGRNLRNRVRRSGNHDNSSDDETENLQQKCTEPVPMPPPVFTWGGYNKSGDKDTSTAKEVASSRNILKACYQKADNQKGNIMDIKSSTHANEKDVKTSMVVHEQKQGETPQPSTSSKSSSHQSTRSKSETPQPSSSSKSASPQSTRAKSETPQPSTSSKSSTSQASRSKGETPQPSTSSKSSTSQASRSKGETPQPSPSSKSSSSQSSRLKGESPQPSTSKSSTPQPSPTQSETTTKESVSSNNKASLKTAKEAAIAMGQKMSDDDFKGYVILNFTELRSQYKQIQTELSQLSQRQRQAPAGRLEPVPLNASFQQPEEEDILYGLPAADLESWQSFNEKLQKDKIFATAVVEKLKNIAEGQDDLGDYIRTILSRVMTNSLASEFSWSGRLNNKPFCSCFMVKVIKWMVKHHTKYPRSKDDIKNVVAAWLRLAPQRTGGKKFQKYKPKIVETTDGNDQNRTPKTPLSRKNQKVSALESSNDDIFNESTSDIVKVVGKDLNDSATNSTPLKGKDTTPLSLYMSPILSARGKWNVVESYDRERPFSQTSKKIVEPVKMHGSDLKQIVTSSILQPKKVTTLKGPEELLQFTQKNIIVEKEKGFMQHTDDSSSPVHLKKKRKTDQLDTSDEDSSSKISESSTDSLICTGEDKMDGSMSEIGSDEDERDEAEADPNANDCTF
ncbi:CLAVATA3/ESR (CLE)-related protein 4A-1 [Frankliniella fusca]|uniref:CLAVATA3/ESR (CLE)-related protein 4A-1 n=1 Tax=Frankliniella fusca TaxID=407009 RepID=A0AAE1LQJ7_9NEOP|nr:CLAVATA3/ESR (CLE)-related protein 4A-1 [Frankliniella fusca]